MTFALRREGMPYNRPVNVTYVLCVLKYFCLYVCLCMCECVPVGSVCMSNYLFLFYSTDSSIIDQNIIGFFFT